MYEWTPERREPIKDTCMWCKIALPLAREVGAIGLNCNRDGSWWCEVCDRTVCRLLGVRCPNQDQLNTTGTESSGDMNPRTEILSREEFNRHRFPEGRNPMRHGCMQASECDSAKQKDKEEKEEKEKEEAREKKMKDDNEC